MRPHTMQEMVESHRNNPGKIDKQLVWHQWIKICGGNMKFAGQQWRLFWSGERGVALHDNASFLSNIFGYEAKK